MRGVPLALEELVDETRNAQMELEGKRRPEQGVRGNPASMHRALLSNVHTPRTF